MNIKYRQNNFNKMRILNILIIFKSDEFQKNYLNIKKESENKR